VACRGVELLFGQTARRCLLEVRSCHDRIGQVGARQSGFEEIRAARRSGSPG
jgi:hypothetical protein